MDNFDPREKNISFTLSENEDVDINKEIDKNSKDSKNENENQNVSFSKVPPEKPPLKSRTVHLPVPANQNVTELIEHDQDEFEKQILQKPSQNILKTDKRIRKILKHAKRNGNSPIIQAINDGYSNMIVPLAFKGYDINIKDENGRSPLYLAILRGQTQLVSELLHLKANMIICDSQGRVPLHIAALVNNRKVANIMIKLGAPVDSQDDQMVTPLMLAAQKGALATLYTLLLGNADPSIKDSHGKTAIDYAEENNYSVIADILTAAFKNSKRTSNVIPKLDNNNSTGQHTTALTSWFSMENIGFPSEGSKASLHTVQEHNSNEQIVGSSTISVKEKNISKSHLKTFCSQNKSELKKMFEDMQKLDNRIKEDSIDGMTRAYLEAQKIELKSKIDQTNKEIDQVYKKLSK